MAPPRVTKRTSRTNFTQSTTHQNAHRLRRKAIDQVKEATNTTLPTDNATGGSEPEALQSTSDDTLEQLLANTVAHQRKRLADRKRAVGEAYRKRRSSMERRIVSAFDEWQDQVDSTHQAQLQRLEHLLVQKASIETAMSKQLASLQKIYDAHSRDVEAVLSHRLKEMKD